MGRILTKRAGQTGLPFFVFALAGRTRSEVKSWSCSHNTAESINYWRHGC